MIILRMLKKVDLPSKIGINHPKWFFKSLDYLDKGFDLAFMSDQKINVTPSGRALFELLRMEAQVLNRKITGKMIPKPISFPFYSDAFCLDWFESSLKPNFLERFLLLHQKTLSEEEAFDFSLLYNELTQNARDHAGSERFIVLLSPSEIGVFDLGVSIPAKLEQKYQFSSDIESIEKALIKGTTTRRLRPGGLGLYYTLNQLREREGYFFIASRRGQLRRYLKNKKVDRKELNPRMRGTLIYCSFNSVQKKKGSK
jgi:hypothetical protein